MRLGHHLLTRISGPAHANGDGLPEARISRLASVAADNWAAEIELTNGLVTTEQPAAVETRTVADAVTGLLNGVVSRGVGRWRVIPSRASNAACEREI